MSATRLDLRQMVRRELMDTTGSPYWADTQIHDGLAAGFGAYSQVFPLVLTAQATSGAGATTLALGTAFEEIYDVRIDGYTVPRVPDAATLYEPATRGTPSQSYVQPVNPIGVSASHTQAWAVINGGATFRYPLTAGRDIRAQYGAPHMLANDDITPVTIPDADLELPVLYACDRLIRSAHTDAIKRGAPGAWADAHDDRGYRTRYDAALRIRRGRVKSSQLNVAM